MAVAATSRLARDTAVVMLLILISRLLGFIRDRAVAEVFGMTWQTDAFRAAFNVPDLMFFLLVGGALNAAFIPVFTEYLTKEAEEEAWRVATSFFNLVIGVLLASTLLGILFTPQLAPLVAYRFEGEQRALLIFLMRIMFPAVFFTAMAGLATGVHRSYRRFIVAMTGPILYNIGIIAGAYGLGPRIGIVGMAIGTVAGAAVNFLVQLPFVWRKARRYPLRFHLGHPGLRRIVRLMLPAIASLSIFQINIIISTNLASGLGEGDITALNLANRLVQFPLGVFAMGVSTVIFPTLTRLVARGEIQTFIDTFGKGLRAVLFVTIPASVGLLALREPVIRLLFEVGAFGPAETRSAAYALLFFSFGLFAQAAIQVLTQVFYSLHETVTLVWVGLLTVAANTLFSLLLLHGTSLGHGGLALAFSLSSILNLGAFLFRLRRRLGPMQGDRLVRTLALAALASAAMGVIAAEAANLVGAHVNLATGGGRLLQVLAGVGAGAAVYAAATAALRMEEVRLVWRLIRRKAA